MSTQKDEIRDLKTWSTPTVTVYGNIEKLTQVPKAKQPGSRDDFNVNGVSDP